MCAQWKGEYNVGLLAKRLEKAKNVDNGTGDVAFRGFETDDVVVGFALLRGIFEGAAGA